jgi:hypothetical protein
MTRSVVGISGASCVIFNHTVGRVLEHIGIEHSMAKRWGE